MPAASEDEAGPITSVKGSPVRGRAAFPVGPVWWVSLASFVGSMKLGVYRCAMAIFRFSAA